MRKGLVAPNRAWEGWTEEELQAILDLHPDVVQVLIFHQQPEPVWNIQRSQIYRLHIELGCQFEYRLCGVGPADPPEEIATWAKGKLEGLPSGKLIPFNEPNHSGEGWINSDWIAWLRRFEPWIGSHELITPALSPNFDMDSLPRLLDLVEEGLYQYLGMHVYSSHHIIGLGNIPICITECNGDLPEKVFSWLGNDLIEEAIWFSSKWIDPDPSYHWDLIGNQGLSESFKRWEGKVANGQFQIGNARYDSQIGQLPIRAGATLYRKREFSDIEEITIHHSGADVLLTTHELAYEMVTHNDAGRTKYPEIPYHITIEPNGRIVVCHPLDKLTWHADGASAREGVGINNWRGVGICLIGDFTNHPPTPDQLFALKGVCNEIDFAMSKKLRRVRHSDVQRTSCPGETSRAKPTNWFGELFGMEAQEDLEKRIAELEAEVRRKDAVIAEAIPKLDSGVALLKRETGG